MIVLANVLMVFDEPTKFSWQNSDIVCSWCESRWALPVYCCFLSVEMSFASLLLFSVSRVSFASLLMFSVRRDELCQSIAVFCQSKWALPVYYCFLNNHNQNYLRSLVTACSTCFTYTQYRYIYEMLLYVSVHVQRVSPIFPRCRDVWYTHLIPERRRWRCR